MPRVSRRLPTAAHPSTLIPPRSTPVLAALFLLSVAGSGFAEGQGGPATPPLVTVAVRNDLGFSRREMVEVKGADIPGFAKPEDLERIHVAPAQGGAEILAQAVDTDGDHDADTLVFQVEIGAGSAARYVLTLGAARTLRKADFRVYGRFVRERHDDFAWENDKVAFRMYGEALETWQREPLTSSTVDAWQKKTPRLTLDDWYLVDDYHRDHGEGGDFYSAGTSRGCGGSGLVSQGRLFTSRNFRRSRVLSRGPIRLLFELEYDAWDVAGVAVRETKRVTLDAGENFNRFESRYTTPTGAPVPEAALPAAGIKRAKGADMRTDPQAGVLRSWEALTSYGNNGWLGCAVLADPARVAALAELDGNVLLTLRGPVYYAGTGWDRSGDFKGLAEFDAHVDAFARRLASPLRVEMMKP